MGAHGAYSPPVRQRHGHPRAEAACRVGKNPHWFLQYFFLFASPDNSALYCFPLPSCLRVSSERAAYFAGVRWSWKPMALSFPLSPVLGGTHREMLHSHLLKIHFTDHRTFLAYRLLTGNWLNSQIFRIFFQILCTEFSVHFSCVLGIWDMGLWCFRSLTLAKVCLRAQNRVCLWVSVFVNAKWRRLSHGDVWIIYKFIDPLICSGNY